MIKNLFGSVLIAAGFVCLSAASGSAAIAEFEPVASDRSCGLETDDTKCAGHTCNTAGKVCSKQSPGSCGGC